MDKRFVFCLAILAFSGVFTACTEDTPTEETPTEALTASVPVTENWIFDKRPNITIRVTNPNTVAVPAEVSVIFSSDMKVQGETVEQSATIPAGQSLDINISSTEDMAPGFYRARCYLNHSAVRYFTFGISPFEISSPPDKQADYDQFWSTALSQLPVLNDDNITLIKIDKKSTSACTVYFVEIPSLPDGPDEEPVLIHGYYLEPTDGQAHPVLLHFQGYDTLKNPPGMSCPSGNNGSFAEFYLSHRGQYINHRPASKRDDGIDRDFENIYGDWFAYNFGNKDAYYYRGAFMDCVQSVHFMATRKACDMSNLFAEGSSQGGALCYAAAALSDIPFTAIAPNVAFLGDFPDYFKIVSWPGDVAKNNQGTMTDEEMYAFLSYFDTKNLATRISCAVWATSGLQDGTCPPHTNLAPFNNLPSTDKQMNFYPEMQHSYPPSWTRDITKFFNDRIK